MILIVDAGSELVNVDNVNKLFIVHANVIFVLYKLAEILDTLIFVDNIELDNVSICPRVTVESVAIFAFVTFRADDNVDAFAFVVASPVFVFESAADKLERPPFVIARLFESTVIFPFVTLRAADRVEIFEPAVAVENAM